jgi:hypothetical protein
MIQLVKDFVDPILVRAGYADRPTTFYRVEGTEAYAGTTFRIRVPGRLKAGRLLEM